MSAPIVVAIVGATAAGKSAIALDLAESFSGEVVNADSMQLYRGMDIGTAKLPLAERRGVPHHLLDVLAVTETASVAVYQQLAGAAVDDIVSRGCTPVVVGGSGLYIRGLLDDLQFPATDQAVRSRLEAELASVGAETLHRRLHAVDPAAAAAILPRNGRRIVRALEVVEVTGRPFTSTLPSYTYRRPTVQFGIDAPLPRLDPRIETRVDEMLSRGLVDEVRALEARGLRDGRTASRALGYAQVLRYLDGALTEREMRDEVVRATRRFARRQQSWFRRDPRIEWLPGERIMERAEALLRRTID